MIWQKPLNIHFGRYAKMEAIPSPCRQAEKATRSEKNRVRWKTVILIERKRSLRAQQRRNAFFCASEFYLKITGKGTNRMVQRHPAPCRSRMVRPPPTSDDCFFQFYSLRPHTTWVPRPVHVHHEAGAAICRAPSSGCYMQLVPTVMYMYISSLATSPP